MPDDTVQSPGVRVSNGEGKANANPAQFINRLVSDGQLFLCNGHGVVPRRR